jgi:uncharacterized membrane protein
MIEEIQKSMTNNSFPQYQVLWTQVWQGLSLLLHKKNINIVRNLVFIYIYIYIYIYISWNIKIDLKT